MNLLFFDRSIEEFVEGLEKPTLAKTLRTLDLLEQFGNGLGMPHGKKVGRGLFELRIRGRLEVRILYAFHDESIVLLVGFIKKSQKIPKKWIDLARRRLDSLANI